MLLACHDKVLRFTGLLVRLASHVEQRGADLQAAEAALSVLRYFDTAAPLHHEDEERDLFPALIALNQADLTACLDALATEHDALHTTWQAVIRPWLLTVTERHAAATPSSLANFVRAHEQHVAQENLLVYPHAARLSPDTLQRVAQAMVLRRTLAS